MDSQCKASFCSKVLWKCDTHEYMIDQAQDSARCADVLSNKSNRNWKIIHPACPEKLRSGVFGLFCSVWGDNNKARRVRWEWDPLQARLSQARSQRTPLRARAAPAAGESRRELPLPVAPSAGRAAPLQPPRRRCGPGPNSPTSAGFLRAHYRTAAEWRVCLLFNTKYTSECRRTWIKSRF